MLLTVGGMALWLGLSDATLSYVRAWLRLPLAVSGVVLLVLALATLRWGSGEDEEPAGDDHGHGAGGPRERLAAGRPCAGPAAGRPAGARLLCSKSPRARGGRQFHR